MSRRDIGVAVDLPEPYSSELQGWRERLGDPNARRIPPHVTLLPPTALHRGETDAVEEHLGRVAEQGRRFRVHLRGSGTFRPLSPVVFVPLAEGISSCERLEAAVRSGPLHRSLTFPYHPHVTVAHDLDEAGLDRAFEALAGYDASFTAWGFSLFELGRDRVWRPQRDFTFGPHPAGPLPGAAGAPGRPAPR